MKIKELKEELKAKAKIIREGKAKRKKVPNGDVEGLSLKRFHARHMHIAYCLLRGRSMEQIENKSREEPSKFWLDFYMKECVDEDVCTGT